MLRCGLTEKKDIAFGVDIVTGLLIKVWSGFIEQHITADVAFGVWQYYTITGDQNYMDKFGYELIFDTARFWVSHLEDKIRQIHETVNEQGITEFTETKPSPEDDERSQY